MCSPYGLIMPEIKFAQPLVGNNEVDELKKVINSGVFVHGSYTNAFEEKFRKETSSFACISVANCTAGLHMAHHYFSRGKRGNNLSCPNSRCNGPCNRTIGINPGVCRLRT